MPLRLVKPKPDPTSRFREWLADTFTVPAGISAGQPFQLHDFQADFLRAYLDTEEGSPRFRSLILSICRKSGKSSFCGALLLGRCLPDSPIYRSNFRAVIVAPTGKFARFIPQACLDLMEAADRSDEIRLRHAPHPGLLEVGTGKAQLLSGDSKSGHGDDVDLAILDEAGLFPRRQDELFDSTFNALAARDGQQIITGTRLDSPRYNEMIERPDPRTYVQLHAADKDADPGDPAQWAKATPGGFKIKSKTFVRDAHEKALASGTLEDFKTSHLNLPGNPARELLLSYDQLSACYADDPETKPDEPCHVGIDLGSSASMTAAAVVYESGVIRVLGAFPGGGMTLMERGKRDAVHDLYSRCEAEGSLFTTAGHVTDLDEFLPAIVELVGNHPVATVSCDRYRREELLNALSRAKLSWQPIFRGQGPKDGDADIRATRKLFMAKAVKLKRSRLLEAGIAEADVRVSATGACQLDRSHATARIDTAQALVLACSALFRAKDAPVPEYDVEVL